MNAIRRRVGAAVARYLNEPLPGYVDHTPTNLDLLRRTLRPGDVVLCEGDRRISQAIKYLTQSCWSHAALYVGPRVPLGHTPEGEPLDFVEADLEKGVVAVSLSSYKGLNLRICRPVNVSTADMEAVIRFAEDHLGSMYDRKAIVDLARFLFPYPPVPAFLRRRMIAMGAGDPTKFICSTLIAEAYRSIGYPILPHVERAMVETDSAHARIQSELVHIEKTTYFVPKDFDVSPYFAIVKPTIEAEFDYRAVRWADHHRHVSTGASRKKPGLV